MLRAELTICSTLQTAFSCESATGNIGTPLDTVSCFVIEPAEPANGSATTFRILPKGEIGELAVGGHQLATSYLNRPEQTSAVFISSPYGRVYRTGDKARMRADGILECLGRLSDGQVKLRGQRLELGEVEQAVMRTTGCHNAVAAVVDSILIAFCAVDAGVADDEILDKCKSWLPAFMIPGEVILMTDFPRLPSGKVDKKKLKSDFEEQKAMDTQNETNPELYDDTDRLVLQIIAETVNAKVDMQTTLASAGLDSLRAIKLASSLRGAGFDVHVAKLLGMRTVADLCSAPRRQSTAKAAVPETLDMSLLAALDSIVAQNLSLQQVASDVEDIFPCAPLQSAMLAETLREPGVYCNEIELETAPNVTADQIALAFRELARRNEILRTGYVPWSNGFVSVLFKEPPSDAVKLVEEIKFDSEFAIEGLPPFQIQIQDRPSEQGPRILIRIHHAVYDGWSMDMMLSDVSDLLRGVEPPGRPSFREVIKFHKQSSARSFTDADRAFWTEHLLGWSNTRFPKLSGRPADSNQTMTARDTFDILPETVEAIAGKTGCSAQTFFQASLALVWSGILGASDIVMGSVTSGRSIPVAGIERILGPCIASMPIRVDFENMSVVLDVLNSIKSSNRAILEHCVLPLSEIKKLAGLQAGDSLYDVLFVYQESVDSRERKNKLVHEVRHLDRLETKLLFEVEPQDGGFAVQATYQSDSFPPDLVPHLIQQFKTAVGNFLDNPHELLQSRRATLDTALSTYNETPRTVQEIPDLAKSFEAAVLRDPTADAILFATSLENMSMSCTTMSYQQLNDTSNRIARFIQASDSETGQVIAIVMEKSINLYASILGIVKAGCAYLPLLPSTPIARLREIFRQGKISRCLLDGATPQEWDSLSLVQFLDVGSALLSTYESSNLEIPADPSRLAYVIYTSGTTGVPKGVAITQKNIVSNATYLESIYPRKSSRREARLLQACSQAFDVSVFEIFFTWHAGMCLCAGTNDVLFADLEHAIRQLEITHLSLTPTVAALIEPKNVPKVEFLVTAGEPMTQPVLDKWGDLLWQGYGPSETTNICSVKRMQAGEHIEHLGWVFPNTSVLVLFPNSLEAVPLGWVGEFCFGGDQVAQGYLNMTELTADKFIQHPKAGRMYRSGDIGRMLADGSLVILGRIDDQIKLRGQRIEAGEINSVITATGVASSAVTMLVRRESDGPEQLTSFFVPKESEGPQIFERLDIQTRVNRILLGFLHSRVSSYMIPSYLVPVSRIPLTSSGKVDRPALRACFKELPKDYLVAASDVTQEPDDDSEWTETESSIANVIAQHTNMERSELGRWTPFATLGLDSISAIGVARSLGSALGVRVPVSAILQNPSVAQLARCLDTLPTTTTETRQYTQLIPDSFVTDTRETFSHESKEVTEVLPCTPLQEAMLSRGQGSYYNKILLRLRTNPDDMRGYWDEMSRRHGILQTCFMTTNDAEHPIAQVVLRNWAIPWRTFDVNVPSLDGAIHDHLRTLPDPLDSRLPPLSLALIRYKGSVFLSFICHHALYDGVAMENLWREVEALANRKQLLPPVSYRPLLEEMLTLPRDVDSFWADHFSGFASSNLFSQSAWRQIDQCTHTTSLEMPFGELQERLRSLGVSLLSLCQATWANVLAVACDLQDVCFGNVMSGRTVGIEGLDRLVAPCFNTIPIRKDISTSSQNLDLLKYFHRLNSDLLRYQFTPLRQVQKIANRQRRGLFDTLLLLQQPLHDMDESVWTLEEDSGDMDIPLVCEVVPCPSLNSVVINMHHDMCIVTGDIAATLADVFKHILRTILSSPYSVPADRMALPVALRSGLSGLAARRERPEEVEQPQSDSEKWSDAEERIQTVLSQLSGVPRPKIRRQTTIFQLGLDSINAVQVASILRRQGFGISASDVIECPTCAKMAGRMTDNSQRKSAASPKYDLNRFSRDVVSQVKSKLGDTDVEAILPCTHMQSAMLSSFIQSGGQNYLNLMTYELDQGVEADALVKAWKSIHHWHPMLRTGFLAVQHRDSTFAMVRGTGSDIPLLLLQDKHAATFDREQWKADARAQFLSSLSIPTWKVALVQGSKGLTMHLLMHHALYDAQSLDVLLGNLSNALQGREIGSPPIIPPGLSYILSKALQDQDDAKRFWQGKATETVVNSFPILTPLREDNRIMLKYETTSSMSFTQLHTRIKSLDYSIQAVIQAAWTRVLTAYLGENTVVFGITLSGRTSDETKDVPIPCLATVPVVASNRSSNADLVKSMMEYNVNVHKHQFSPLSQVQKWLGHPATPVFDTLLAYQKMERDHDRYRPWKLIGDDAMVEYPVSLEVEPIEDDKIQLRITFFSDVIPQEHAALVVQQFDAAVADLVHNPTGTSNDSFKGESQLFSIEPAVSPEMSSPVSFLHQFVEIRAISDPDTTALEFVSKFDGTVPVKQTWSYRELDNMGNRVANILKQHAPVGSIVAVHFNKCPEAYFSILGILKAGCAFVALDPTAPRARREFILRDSQAPCLLTDSIDAIDFEASAKIVVVNKDSLQHYAASRRELGNEFTPANTCYCLYTSGTTGTPKGCEITHDNAVQAMMAFQELFRGHWTSESRWLQFAALHFDVSVLEQYWSWSIGITVVAAPKDLILDDLIASINQLNITHIDLTPSLARLTHPDDVPSLCKGVFITGGEQLKQEILDAWGPKAVIYNAYGPTEATIGVTMYQRVPINGRPSNIGRQFPNVGSYVFRQGTEIPVLRGGVGELCVSGKLVGKGYLKRPELTEERFPTLAEFGERVYRTGDLVRILHDGCFEFLGRADDQVKLRGQRLEIGEINHAIRAGASQVQDVATIVARHSSSGKDVLVSFLVGKTSAEQTLQALPDADDLGSTAKAACRERLPGYMVPTYFLRLPYIPLSPNNKAEVKELRNLFSQLSQEQLMDLTAARKLPITQLGRETTDKLIHALSEFSGIAPEDMSDATSIFDIGIDSITALQLSSNLRSKGLKTVSPAMLLRNPIVADLVDALSKKESDRNSGSVRETKQAIQACHHRYRGLACRELGVKPAEIEYIAPCSPLQQGIVSKTMTDDEQGAYFNSFELRIGDNISVERLQKAWDDLIASHAILRTAFVNTASGCVQVALKHRPSVWEQHSVTAEEKKDFTEAKRHDWVKQNDRNITSPLQLIYLEGPGIRRLVINIFHAIYDGNSFDLMMQHVADLYHDKKIPQSPSFLESLAHGPLWKYDHCRQFWLDHLHDWKASPMPTLTLSEDNDRAVAHRIMPANRLEDVRKTQNVTLQSVVLSLWTSTLERIVPGGITVGVVVAGRSINLPGVERTIGPLFNTVPFLSGTTRRRSWASLIRDCHNFNTSILSFQHVPLQNIQKWCSGGKPLFDNLFTFQVEQPVGEGTTTLWEMMENSPSPDYPLALEATRLRNGELQLLLAAQPHVANEAKLEELLDWLEENIASVAADLDQTPSQLDDPETQRQESSQKSLDKDTGSQKEAESFVWTAQALAIRIELATMADAAAEDITPSQTILELGLDSIDVIKLSAKLRKQGLDLSASQIMRQQTIAKMTQLLDEATPDLPEDESTGPSIDNMQRKLEQYLRSTGVDTDNLELVLPPTALQESMVASMVQSDFKWYFNHDVLEIMEHVDMQKLREAWARVIQQSQILRTGFVGVDDASLDMAYCQVVLKDYIPIMVEAHLSDISEIEQVVDDATALARRGNAATNLFQLRFVTVGSRKFVVVSIAHALYDGWSLNLMYHDLEVAYKGTLYPRASAESFLSKSMSSTTDNAREFWAEYLDGVSPTLLPAQTTQPALESASHKKEKPATTAFSDISAFCKTQSISLQALCQACWAMVLARRTKSLDVVFGVVLSGRDFDGAEELMFPTMNTVALRCVLHGSSSAFLTYLEETMASIREFQAFPLRKAQLAARTSGGELFNSLFMLQKASGVSSENPLLKSVDGSAALDYPVCVEAEVVGEELVWRVACQARFFSENGAENLVEELDRVLRFMTANKTSDILTFQEQGVAVCGLPTVVMQDAEVVELPTSEDSTQEDQNWSTTATTIREVLSDVSNVPLESVTATTSLYHLGLDSISAIKVSSLLRKHNIQVKPRELLKATSIQQMAGLAIETPLLDDPQTESLEMWSPPRHIDIDRLLADDNLSRDAAEAILPALPMQVFMISSWQNANGAVFFPEFRYRVQGTTDAERIHAAWKALVRQTPILRTCFVPTGSRDVPLLQVVVREVDTARQPLVSLGVTRDGDDGLVLRLKIHHALYDGVSLPAIVQNLTALINNMDQVLDQGIQLWTRYTIRPALTASRSARQAFWTRYLDGCPTGTPDTPTSGSERVSYLRRSAVADVSRARVNAAQYGISIQSLFFAAYARVLAAERNQPAVVFGIYLAGQDEQRLSSTYPTLNLVPLRVKTSSGDSIANMAAAIQQDVHLISSDRRADVGLWEVAAWTGIKVTSFVNFLSLPSGGGTESPPRERGRAAMLPAQEAALLPVAAAGDEDVPQRAWLAARDNSVRDAFPVSSFPVCPGAWPPVSSPPTCVRDTVNLTLAGFPPQAAVDVEASIRGGGLDVGVFGSARCVSQDGAAKLVEDIVACLGEVSGEG